MAVSSSSERSSETGRCSRFLAAQLLTRWCRGSTSASLQTASRPPPRADAAATDDEVTTHHHRRRARTHVNGGPVIIGRRRVRRLATRSRRADNTLRMARSGARHLPNFCCFYTDRRSVHHRIRHLMHGMTQCSVFDLLHRRERTCAHGCKRAQTSAHVSARERTRVNACERA